MDVKFAARMSEVQKETLPYDGIINAPPPVCVRPSKLAYIISSTAYISYVVVRPGEIVDLQRGHFWGGSTCQTFRPSR